MNMLNRIKALSLIAFMLVSCSDFNTTIDSSVEVPLDPDTKFIHFDAGISTRGHLISGNVLEEDFAVLGYLYRGDWDAVKVMTSPNVFDSTPEIVKYQGGYFSYDAIQPWTGNTYSFFAYYPTNNPYIKVFDGNGAKSGEPYILYEPQFTSDPTTLVDIMTASYINTSVNSSTSVVMNMRHRLTSVDIAARNYYEFDHDGNANTAKIPVTIEITDLEVNLSNLIHTKAKIYLNPSIPTEYPGSTARINNTFKIVSKSASWTPDTFDVKPNSPSDTDMRLITTQSGENASSLLLIPQEEHLTGGSIIRYKKKYQDNNGNWVYIPEIEGTQDYEFEAPLNINFNRSLLEGRRYYIQLTFTSDAVSINIIAADEWDELESGDINHDFE